MGRLLTLTTCQWADMTIDEIAGLAKKMGYDGLEISVFFSADNRRND